MVDDMNVEEAINKNKRALAKAVKCTPQSLTEEQKAQARENIGAAAPGEGDSGATFTPAVAADGTLSWTNDKGLENPASVNIMGPQGATGADGADGYTPVKGTDYFTAADKAELLTSLQSMLGDYIVGQGVTDGWTWRKWSSGVSECWGHYDVGGVDCSTAAGSLYRTETISPDMPFPDGLFIESPMNMQMTFNSYQGTPAFIWGNDSATHDGGASGFMLMRHATATIYGRMQYSYKGRWKE